jgi:hypothetical protein
VDELHTLHLGVFQDYVLTVLWACIEEDIWGARAGKPQEQHCLESALKLKGLLFSWYASEKRDRDRPVYELADFTLATIGTVGRPSLSAKAAESGTLLRFALWMAERNCALLQRGAALVAAGRGLVGYLDLTRSRPMRFEARDRQMLADTLLKFLGSREAAGIPFKPKTHLCCHLVRDAAVHGNPCRTGTWVDESLNARLAEVCKGASRAVWAERVLSSFAHEAGPTARAAEQQKKKARRA